MDALERLIPKDEAVLFDRRAQGRPPLGPVLASYLCIVGLGVLAAKTVGPIVLSLPTFDVPLPLWLPAAGLVVAIELLRIAQWRSTRFVATTRRVLVLRGVVVEGVIACARRRGLERPLATPRGAVLLGPLEGALELEGISREDARALEESLVRFDPADPAPLPPPFWTTARRAGLVVTTLLALFILAWQQAAPDRLTVQATWTKGLRGPDTLTLAVESPSVYCRNHVQWVVIDAVVGPAGVVPSVGATSYRRTVGAFRSDVAARVAIAATAGAGPIRLEGRVQLQDRDVPFVLELAPDETGALDLGGLIGR